MAYEVARESLTNELSRIDGLDAKMATIFGFASAAVAIAPAVLISGSDLSRCTSALLITSFSVYILLASTAIFGLWPRRVAFGLNLTYFWGEPKLDDPAAKWLVAEAFKDAVGLSEQVADRKVKLLECVMLLSFIQVALIFVAFLTLVG